LKYYCTLYVPCALCGEFFWKALPFEVGFDGWPATGILSPRQDGHEGHAVLIADQAVKMGRFLVDDDNNILFRKRRG